MIGTYHVFIALSRMQFFPAFLLKRNTLRGTPHFSILLATIIPIAILLLVNGNITLLGDMYAFGLLGAFTLTCLGLDIIRHRERKAARNHPFSASAQPQNGKDLAPASGTGNGITLLTRENPPQEHTSSDEHVTTSDPLTQETPPSLYAGDMMLNPWYTFKFSLGLLTTCGFSE
jgi:amino acid transporter